LGHGILVRKGAAHHDRTFADTGKAREVAEAALAHTIGGVKGAYFRSDLFERRRRLMDAWAAFLTGSETKVVALHG